MRILFVTAEVGPFVSVGGLSQVSFFLPKALRRLGEEVVIFTPKFGAMDQSRRKWKLNMETESLRVPLADMPNEDDLICNIKSFTTKEGIKTYFLENREYYELRANVFGYKDDHVRFMLMCKGALEWILLQQEKGDWLPEIIHCHDWHAAYLIDLARRSPRYKKALEGIKLILTVHNLVYQGNFDYKYCAAEDRDDGSLPLGSMMDSRLHTQNALMRGIIHADAITTVSPTYAQEVMTEEYGEGLQKVLKKRRNVVSGILNGLDTEFFDPSKDKTLKSRFSQLSFVEERANNKRELQKLFDLPTDSSVFLIAFSGRLTSQKGLNLIIDALPQMLVEHADIQIVFLGGGEEIYRKALTLIQLDYPKQVGLHLVSNFTLPRKIFAGADCLLMPSIFEPGGIVALEALRYGAVPIVRRTGGLNDIVVDFNPETGIGNGFSFCNRHELALYGAIIQAKTTFANKNLWYKLISNCLASDFSWNASAKQYQKLYRRIKSEL